MSNFRKNKLKELCPLSKIKETIENEIIKYGFQTIKLDFFSHKRQYSIKIVKIYEINLKINNSNIRYISNKIELVIIKTEQFLYTIRRETSLEVNFK